LANFASKAWDAMMGWGRESGTERAKELEKLINETTLEVQRRQSKGLKTGSQEAALASFRTELKDIVDREMAALDAAEAKAKKATENQKKIKAYSGAGGLTKEIEIQSAIDKAIANNKYLKAVEISNEIQKIELEAAKEIREKNLEFNKKSAEEQQAFGGLLAKQLSEEIYTIELKRDEKLRAIRIKQAQADFNAMESWKEQNRADLMVETKRTESLEKAARDQTRNMEFQRDSLQMKYQLIYATEREQKLAQISLEYARRRREVEGQNPEVLKEIDRQEAMAQMFVVMEESAKRTQQVFDSVFNNLTSAIDNFVKTGKLNFKDLARSIIQDLIAIQMRAATMTFLRGMFSSFGGTGSTYNASGGIAEHVFNPSAYTGKAAGGSVTNNTPYLVGERGPEVFVPSGSGTIIPNGQVGSMGGQTNVTNNYINAIDVKSFETKLLESSNTIWAANQYANKQLATNGRRA
jgi:lambda family phage tail tape measure protein